MCKQNVFMHAGSIAAEMTAKEAIAAVTAAGVSLAMASKSYLFVTWRSIGIACYSTGRGEGSGGVSFLGIVLLKCPNLAVICHSTWIRAEEWRTSVNMKNKTLININNVFPTLGCRGGTIGAGMR